jgi:hypothetical protein
MSVSMLSCSLISPEQCLPPPVCTVQFVIEALRCCMTVKEMLRAIHQMLCVRWLPHQPSHTFDDVFTPEFDRELEIVIPFHIHESVQFPLPDSQIIRRASNELLDAIPTLEARNMQSGVIFHQHVVIVRLYALLPEPTVNIFVLFTCRKRIVGHDSYVRLKETLRVAFPWLSNVIA